MKTFSSSFIQDKGLTRTQFAVDRGIIYRADGTGRDSYVFNSNGGFCFEHKPFRHEKTAMHPLPNVNNKSYYRAPAPVVHAKPVQYKQDGSGRDFYIM